MREADCMYVCIASVPSLPFPITTRYEICHEGKINVNERCEKGVTVYVSVSSYFCITLVTSKQACKYIPLSLIMTLLRNVAPEVENIE